MRGGIVRSMLPLASVGGPAIIAVVIVPSVLFLWWLLRSDAREEDTRGFERDTVHKVDPTVGDKSSQR
jgi:hypothetical protein